MDEPDDTTVAVWTRLMRAGASRLASIEAALRRAEMPPLEWYDALLEIERAGPEGIRPFLLKDRLLLPQYGISRLLSRIEAAGLIERKACAEDGRGQAVVLTEAGRDLRRRIWPVYAAELRRGIGDRLTPAEAATLADLLGKLT